MEARNQPGDDATTFCRLTFLHFFPMICVLRSAVPGALSSTATLPPIALAKQPVMRGCPSPPCVPGCWGGNTRPPKGHAEFPPLIRPASRRPPWLSFSNLIEAHVLRSLRAEHGVSVEELRRALAYAEKTLGIDRLLLRPELRTNAGKALPDRYGELIESTASGQLAMRRLFEEHLKRIEWTSSRFPVCGSIRSCRPRLRAGNVQSLLIRGLPSDVRWW